jgi:type II secretory pathway pseudopilin PulG
MLVTIFVMTVAVVGITGALAQTEKIAGISQDQSQLEVAMRQLADYARDSSSKGLQYVYCATTASYGAAKLPPTMPTGVTSWGVSAVTLASSVTRNGIATTPVQSCGAAGGDWGVQEVTVFVQDGTRTLSRTVWKSATW